MGIKNTKTWDNTFLMNNNVFEPYPNQEDYEPFFSFLQFCIERFMMVTPQK